MCQLYRDSVLDRYRLTVIDEYRNELLIFVIYILVDYTRQYLKLIFHTFIN